MREIASTAHMAFSDIGKIIKRLDGQSSNNGDIDLSNKSKATQALWLFEPKNCPIDVAIELDIPYYEIEELQQANCELALQRHQFTFLSEKQPPFP